MTSDALVDGLLEEGFTDAEKARRSLRSTLAVLGERLVDAEAKALAEQLPDELAEIVEDVEYDYAFGTKELYERVRRRERTTPAAAREHAEMVLTVLGRALARERRARIARALPERAGELLLVARDLRAGAR
jgi:uncharacterized protein (DUF2267 family)